MKKVQEPTVERTEHLIILTNQAMIMETLAHFMQNLVGDIERTHKIRQAVDATVKYLDGIKPYD